MPELSTIADLLACPQCFGPLDLSDQTCACKACSLDYAIENGVALLARKGTTDTWDADNAADRSSAAYQERYQDTTDAADYNQAYKQKLFKRWSTQREYRILNKLLGSQVRSATLLDLPCGGGRLSPQIGAFTDLIIEADIAKGQVIYGKESSTVETPQVWMTASAFHIPLADSSVDATVCCRLSHHLPTPEERERLLCELLRVSKRFVIMTFFDYHSLKNSLRRLRRKSAKLTMTRQEVADIARKNGATLVADPALSSLSSGHRYALMIKDPA